MPATLPYRRRIAAEAERRCAMTDEATTPDEVAEGRKPGYSGFGTFENFIARLAKSGVPDIIERQFIGGSWGSQSQMIGTLTYLGLIEDGDKPSGTLRALAAAGEESRPDHYRELV